MTAGARFLGRYVIYEPIAAGGTAVVHLGRLLGPVGFSKIVAIKVLDRGLAKQRELVERFLEEARLAARIQHPNVVSTLDVIASGSDVGLVMEYIAGDALSSLLRAAPARGLRCPPPIAAAIVVDLLRGLAFAHDARGPTGEPLALVHRDLSPENVLVGSDGVARVLDFGIAKAIGQAHATRTGVIKGKLAYLAPELLEGEKATVQSDLFAVGAVLWEAVVGRRLFDLATDIETVALAMRAPMVLPSAIDPSLPRAFDAILDRALTWEPAARYRSAREMAQAIEATCEVAKISEVGAWVGAVAGEQIAARERIVLDLERRAAVAETSSVGAAEEPTQTFERARAAPSVRRQTRAWRWLVVALVIGATSLYAAMRMLGPSRASEVEPPSTAPEPAAPSEARDPSGGHDLSAQEGGLPPPSSATARAPHVLSSSAPRPRPIPGAPPLPGCDPPYSVDEAGRKHYRVECLREGGAR